MDIITFDHLLNEELFKKVKKEFLERDFKYKELELSEVKVDMNEDEIFVVEEKIVSTRIEKHNDIDPHTGEIIEVIEEINITEVIDRTLKFTDEINALSEYYKNSFEKNLLRRNLFSKEAVKGFSEFSMNRLNIRKDQVLKSTHLDQPVKDKLLEVIDDIYEFISNEHYQKSKAIPKKIPLNLNKNEVITLFRLLSENELISDSLKPTDLARLIEENFTYFDSTENIYKDIKKARKLELQLFGENPYKSSEPSLKILEEIFHDKDFFSI